jgi:ribosome-binding factor A
MRRSDDTNSGHRHARIEELILEELRSLFRDDVSDPALRGVRIARLVLSVDYRHVRVHFLLAPLQEATETPVPIRLVEARLKVATPFLRARLAEAIELKRLPDITFVFDAATPVGEGA